MINTMLKTTVVSAIAAAAIAGSAMATGPQDGDMLVQSPPTDARRAEISLAGYNVQSEAGYKAVSGKIRGAVKKVCAELSTHPLAAVREAACERTARADGMAQLAAIRDSGEQFADAGSIRIGR